MKITYLLFVFAALLIASCSSNNGTKTEESTDNDSIVQDNPFLSDYNTPFNLPPFDKIKNEHYIPAIKEAIKKQTEEIEAIVNNTDEATFENTLVAYDNSGIMLNEVENVLDNMSSAMTSDEIQAISAESAPILSAHRDDIKLNAKLFERIRNVYDNKDELSLNGEQLQFLTKIYNQFVRGGAGLPEEKQARFRELNERLSVLTIKIGDNLLAETNRFKLIIDKEEDLAGLPQSVIDAGAADARAAGIENGWLYTLQTPSRIPFLTYSDKRELREKVYKAYTNKGNNNDEYDTKVMLLDMVKLRSEKAQILGFKDHASYVLDNNMAKTPEKVFELLDQLMASAVEMSKNEVKEMQSIIDKEGGNFKLEPWDWAYYAEKVKKEKYAFDEEAIRPYLQLSNVLQGAFDVAGKLFGLQFIAKPEIKTYHEDASAYEVLDKDGSHLGILFMDWHPRESKRGGAWMTGFRKQSRRNNKDITPVIQVVCNFSKPTADKPSLLSFEEVQTLFHEFGHALHGLLSNCTYHAISGTSVSRDFVELPSQIMENWAAEPEVMKMYAKHYETGEVIPHELIDKLINSGKFNQGFATTEAMAAALLDMYWHTISDTSNLDVLTFENDVVKKIGLIDEITFRYRSTYFAHIFAGGYSAGYYSYVWAEILDADAFELFKEKGIFDQETAQSFRDNVLSIGNSQDLMVAYTRFRGAEPSLKPLLKRKGFE